MSELVTYTKVNSVEEAEDLIDLLESSGIAYEVERDKNVLDKVFIGDDLDQMVSIKIPEEAFEEVNALVKAQAKTHFNSLNPDYYLLHFTNEELINVVKNPADWNAFDQGVAEKLLADRNVEVTAEKVNDAVASYKPLQIKFLYLILEYLISMVLLYAGIITGLATIYAYRTLSNGRRVKMYDETSRQHGKIMIAIGIVRLFVTVYKFYF